MLHIQESISRFVCSATDAINSKKISRSEIENLKSQDLGRKGSLAPVYEAEEVEEPNSNTLASELGSSSLAFIKDMGFLKLAERLTGRFEEVKNSWQQREDKLKEETKQNKDLVKRLEEEISAQKEKIEKLSCKSLAQERLLITKDEEIKSISEELCGLTDDFKHEIQLLSAIHEETVNVQKDSTKILSEEIAETRRQLESEKSINELLKKRNKTLEEGVRKAHDASEKLVSIQKEPCSLYSQEYLEQLGRIKIEVEEKTKGQTLGGKVPGIDLAILENGQFTSRHHDTIFAPLLELLGKNSDDT